MLPRTCACMTRTSCFMLRDDDEHVVCRRSRRRSPRLAVDRTPGLRCRPCHRDIETAEPCDESRSTRARTVSSLRTSAFPGDLNRPKTQVAAVLERALGRPRRRRPEITTVAPLLGNGDSADGDDGDRPPVLRTKGCSSEILCWPLPKSDNAGQAGRRSGRRRVGAAT